MRHHTHLTLEEREEIMCRHRQHETITAIADALKRHKSTISRELSRNMCTKGSAGEFYRASTAQRRYERRRLACRRPAILDDPAVLSLVASKILEEQWSPEQIEGRLRLEGGPAATVSTVYRGISSGRLDGKLGGRKAACRLRRKGRGRKGGREERRGKIKVSHEISERPAAADSRSELGHWESDTVAGREGGACLLTLVDRKSGLLVGGKQPRKRAEQTGKAMVRALKGQPCLSVTLDRGKEFAGHAAVTEATGAECYFALPHHPWQRGTNENTNGLLREYFPKGKSIDDVRASEVQEVYDKLNRRPRKRLGYRTPLEVHYGMALQLI